MRTLRRLLLTSGCAAFLAAGAAQYYPYGYPAGADAYGQVGAVLSDLQAGQGYYMNQMDQIGLQIQAQLSEYNRYFINLYRTTTGDLTSPDAYALQGGQMIHCQRYPLDCQLAMQSSQAAQAAQQSSFNAWMAGVQQKDAANDAAFSAWMQAQNDQQSGHDAYVRGAILGVGEYGNAETGGGYYLPFAPGQGTYYETPTGLPLVFDQSSNTWYQTEVDGTYTPYYEVK